MRKRLFLYIGLLALFASCEKYNDVIVEEQFDERFIEESIIVSLFNTVA